MTNSEKNPSNSENIDPIQNYMEEKFIDLHYEIGLKTIVGQSTFVHHFVGDFYFNLLTKADNQTISYQLDDIKYLLNGGECIMHAAQKGTLFRIDSLSENNCLIFICIPTSQFGAYAEKTESSSSDYSNGFMTKNDKQASLIFDTLIGYSYSSPFEKLKSASLVLELLIRQAELLLLQIENPRESKIHNHYEKALMARQLIDTDLSKTYSISELAKAVGTNEQYLKKYFKLYFNKTIQTYTTDRKMLYAKDLIVAGDHRIADVARLTGYKHATHFTTAFKKHFGFIPNSLKY